MVVASALLFEQQWPSWVDGAIAGASAGVIGLFSATVLQLLPSARRARGWLAMALIAFVGNGLFGVNFILLLVAGGAISLWLNRPGAAE